MIAHRLPRPIHYHSTRNEGQIEETFIPALSPPFSSTMISEVSTEQTYGSQVSVDEPSENKAQLAYPPSDGTDASQLLPLVPVRPPSRSQPNDRIQSATTSPLVAQNTSTKVSHSPTPAGSAAPQDHQLPSQYSQESYRVPAVQTPQTHPSRTSGSISTPRISGESWNLDPSSSLTHQQYTTPLQQSAPTTPSMYPRISSQPYGPSAETPQPHSSGPTQVTQPLIPQASQSVYEGTRQQFVPRSAPTRLYRLPGTPVSQDQLIYAGLSQPFISQTSGSPFGHVSSRKPFPASPYSRPTASSRYDFIAQTTGPQTIKKTNGFVANDPFRVTHGNEKVNSPSDGLTFDDIPTAGSSSGPTLSRPSRSYSLPSMPIQSRYSGTPQQFTPHSLPNMLTPQAQSIHAGTPQQSTPHSLPKMSTPQAQSIHAGTPPQFVPQSVPSQFYSTSDAPKPQASQPGYAGTPQQFIPQSTSSQFYNIPNASTPQAQSIHTGTPQPSQITGSFPGAPYAPPTPHSRSRHRFDGFVYINVPSPDVPPTQIPITWSPIRAPSTPFIPPLLEDDASSLHRLPEDTGLAQSHLPSTPHIQLEPPKSVPSPPVQSQAQAPVYEEEVSWIVPSIHHSHMPFSQREPQMGASQSFYAPYAPYLQHSQYQHPNLPKKSIFSRLIRSFRWSNRTHSLAPRPFTAIYPQPFTEPFTVIYPPMDPEIDWHEAAVEFWLVAFPKQMYLLFLLRLPSLYFSRVSRIFEEADMSLPEIKKMALETASQGLTHEFEMQMAFESPSVPPAYKRLTSTWESFIDSVMREWKTFNIISVLLLTYDTFNCTASSEPDSCIGPL